LCPNISLSTLFSNNFTLWFSRNIRDQVSHPCKTKWRIIVPYIFNFVCYSKRENNRYCTEITFDNYIRIWT
jgi:hypothetical protein